MTVTIRIRTQLPESEVNAAIDWMLKRSDDYGLAVSTEGQFICKETHKVMHDGYLRYEMLKDYKNLCPCRVKGNSRIDKLIVDACIKGLKSLPHDPEHHGNLHSVPELRGYL